MNWMYISLHFDYQSSMVLYAYSVSNYDLDECVFLIGSFMQVLLIIKNSGLSLCLFTIKCVS